MIDGNNELSKLSREIKISAPVNFGEYTEINQVQEHAHKNSYINCFSYNYIYLASKPCPYPSTVFGQFDNYLINIPHKKIT